MRKNKILNKVYLKKLNIEDAYNMLYKRPVKIKKNKSNFLKIRITIYNQPYLTAFLKIIFLLPLPTFIISKFMNDELKDFIDLIEYKKMSLEVSSKDAKIKLKTI